jgi:hypothetical protein
LGAGRRNCSNGNDENDQGSGMRHGSPCL